VKKIKSLFTVELKNLKTPRNFDAAFLSTVFRVAEIMKNSVSWQCLKAYLRREETLQPSTIKLDLMKGSKPSRRSITSKKIRKEKRGRRQKKLNKKQRDLKE